MPKSRPNRLSSRPRYYSPKRLLRLAGVGVIMTAVSAAGAFDWFPGRQASDFQRLVLFGGVAIFGLGTCVILWRALTRHAATRGADVLEKAKPQSICTAEPYITTLRWFLKADQRYSETAQRTSYIESCFSPFAWRAV